MIDDRTASEAREIATQKLMRRLGQTLDSAALDELIDWLQERTVLHDGQEDPGAVMSEGLELELAIASVFRDFSDKLRRQRDAVDPAS